MTASCPRVVGVVLFEGFELLDVFGPLEVFGNLKDLFSITMIGPQVGPVSSSQGPNALANYAYGDAPGVDIVLVPGGWGTRSLIEDHRFLEWLASWTAPSEFIASVCTGSAVLGAAGILNGYRATTNKRAFAWAQSHGENVTWIPEARWVQDSNRWTSSGVSAGIDMALGLVQFLHGDDVANKIADGMEYDWHRDPAWDPFAAKNGLVAKA